MANGHENLIPHSQRSKEEARENGRKGGQASGEARRRKRDMRDRVIALMEAPADPSVARGMSKTGVQVNDMADAILAGLMRSALKGDVKAFDKLMEYSGQSVKEQDRREIKELEKRKAQLEAERAEMENELYRMRLNAIKGLDDEEIPDDGFLEALESTAAEDWENDI